MEDRKEEKKSENRIDKQENKNSDTKQTTGIRCYGRTGFFAPVTLPDGTKVQKFFYGREGD